MSGAPATVSAGPPGPAVAIAPSNAVEQAPEGAGDQGSFQSFNEVLSAQRAESGHDRGERHDTGGKKGPSHGAKEVQGTAGSPQSAPADDLPAGSPPALGMADVTAVSAAGAGAPGTPNPASGASTSVTDAGGDADPGPAAPLSDLAASTASAPSTAPDAAGTAATETAASDGDLPAVITEAVSGTGSGAPAHEPAGVASAETSPAGSTANGTAATTKAATTTVLAPGLADPKASALPAVAVPSHGGATTEAGAGHGAPAPAVANVAGSTPVASPLPHLVSAGPLAASDTSRAAPRVGESAAASTESAAPGASPLDVEGLSGSISRPLSDGNGTYTVTVALHPPELGHLQAVVSLDGNDLQVSLTAQTQTGHDALANATEALKNQLARGGVNVNVSLRDPGSQAGGEQRYRPPTTSGAGSFITEGSAAEAPIPSGLGAGQIHLVL